MGSPMMDDGQLEMFPDEPSELPWSGNPMDQPPEPFDIVPKTGDELKAEGMARAEEHCEADLPGWTAAAVEKVAEFSAWVKTNMKGLTFNVNDVRTWAEGSGFPQPPSARGWGPAMLKAARAGIIKKVGADKSSMASCHSAFITRWEVSNGVPTSGMDK